MDLQPKGVAGIGLLNCAPRSRRANLPFRDGLNCPSFPLRKQTKGERMRVKVKLFARYRDVVGQGEIDVETAPGTTVGALWQILADRYPSLAALGDSTLFAVNKEYAGRTQELREDDEVALIPPVSGG